MSRSSEFFAREEQSAFLKRVYDLAPPAILEFFAQEESLLRKALSGCACVLEIGCGYGRALGAVPASSHYTGIDIGFAYVRDGRQQHPDRDWICADACRLPFEAGTFDALFCIQNTLGNMPDIERQVMAEAFRVGKSKVIVGVYSEDSFEERSLWYNRMIAAGIFGRVWVDPDAPRIARSDTGWRSRCFDRDELTRLFEQNGAHAEITAIDRFSYFCVASRC